MLLARLFQSLEHPEHAQESLPSRAFRRGKSLLRQDIPGGIVAPRSQRGGVLGAGRRMGRLTLTDGIIPVAGGFIP